MFPYQVPKSMGIKGSFDKVLHLGVIEVEQVFTARMHFLTLLTVPEH